jgi:hypothetical protein
MLSCKEATRMIAGDTGRDTSLRGRLSLTLHLAMCRTCRAYARSLRLIGETARRLYQPSPADLERSQATLDAVRRTIRTPPGD